MERLLCWEKIKGDGFAFENIINELLKAMFPLEQYIHTQETRDGGKDFICITKNEDTYWAECKNYTDNLALSDVAKTFVMAIAEDIKKILIFSISPFTEIALREMSSLTKRIQYELEIYDGDALNALMNQYIDVINLSDNFKRDFRLSYTPSQNLVVFSDVIRNDYLSGTVNNVFYVGDLITYNFYFKNNSQKTLKIKCNNPQTIPKELFLIPSLHLNDEFELQPGSYAQCSYQFRIVNYKKKIDLFGLHYSVDGNDSIVTGQSIQCDWIAEVALLGASREQLEYLQNRIIGNKELEIINLYGCSGVGKSRLIKEIRNTYQNQNYKTIFLPIHEKRENGKTLLRKIISTIKNLPYLANENIHVNNSGLIYQVLYNTQYDIAANIDHILQIAEETIDSANPLVVIIDDVQFGDQLLFLTIRKILNLVSNKIILITGFNTDFIYKDTDAYELFNQIKEYAFPNVNLELKNFSQKVAEQYLYNCLDPKLAVENRLKKTLDLFLQKVGTNPLLLHQTILFLSQKQVFVKEGDVFFIKEISQFHNMIGELNSNFKNLLGRRHKTLKENIPNSEYTNYLILVSLLTILHSIPIPLYEKMFSNIDSTLLNELIALGFIKYNDEGDIVFYHQKLENFYSDLKIDPNILKSALHKLESFPTKFFHEKFILKEKCNLLQQSDVDNAFLHLNDADFANEYAYISAVYRSSHFLKKSNENLLKVTDFYYEIVQAHRGIRYCLTDYEKTIYQFLDSIYDFKENGSLLWMLALRCINAFIQLHQEKNALSLLLVYESKLEILECDLKEKKNIIAAIYNRYGVVYNSFNDFRKAKYYYRKSLKIGLEIHDKYKIIEAYSDYGFLFYDQKGKLWKTVYYWEKMFFYFQKTQNDHYEYLIPKCYYHKIYTCILVKNYKKAEKLIKDYKKNYWEQTHGHYRVKILFVNIMLELIKCKNLQNVDYKEVDFLLNEVEDECICIGTVREYYKVLYLKAIYYLFYRRDMKTAYTYLIITYQQICGFCEDSEYLLLRTSHLLVELRNLIQKCERENKFDAAPFFSNQEQQQLSEYIDHIYKNGGNQYTHPLRIPKLNIIFPKL